MVSGIPSLPEEQYDALLTVASQDAISGCCPKMNEWFHTILNGGKNGLKEFPSK